jgi:phage gpG-like protein
MSITLKKGPNFPTDIKERGSSFHRDVKNIVERNIFKAEGIAKREYLSGPRPEKLGVVTGNLRASVRASVDSNGTIKGILSAGPLPYAAIHEFGGYAGRGRRTKIPKRSYLRPAIEKVLGPLKEEINKAYKRLQK